MSQKLNSQSNWSNQPSQSTGSPHFSSNQTTTGCGNCGYQHNGMCSKGEKCYGSRQWTETHGETRVITIDPSTDLDE